MEKGVVNPKVQTLMKRDSSFASEQRPTVQWSKVSFLKLAGLGGWRFLLLLLSYIT